jgi:DNA invertase Pin-like site-specific DNA recombinase
MDIEKHTQLVQVLGKERIEKAYELLKAEKISFALLKKIAQREEIRQSINEGIPFSQIAKKLNISKMSVYRFFKKR